MTAAGTKSPEGSLPGQGVGKQVFTCSSDPCHELDSFLPGHLPLEWSEVRQHDGPQPLMRKWRNLADAPDLGSGG